MYSFILLKDTEFLEIYKLAKEVEVSSDFIFLLEQELHKRQLL
ncbi:sporulation histidine kinase inhibitor Sda [Falsibacillus albus]|nr:sporulation histidine kinase inhibitor Sda [Falsibacillus albus]